MLVHVNVRGDVGGILVVVPGLARGRVERRAAVLAPPDRVDPEEEIGRPRQVSAERQVVVGLLVPERAVKVLVGVGPRRDDGRPAVAGMVGAEDRVEPMLVRREVRVGGEDHLVLRSGDPRERDAGVDGNARRIRKARRRISGAPERDQIAAGIAAIDAVASHGREQAIIGVVVHQIRDPAVGEQRPGARRIRASPVVLRAMLPDPVGGGREDPVTGR